MSSQTQVQSLAVAVGSTLSAGRYRLLEKVGEGGQAVVYRALEQGGAVYRQVAIKLLKTSAGPQPRGAVAAAERRPGARQVYDLCAATQQTLRREVGFMASLPTHPHVMQVYHDGSPPDPYFYAMEFVPQARSLDCVLRAAKEHHRHIDLAQVRHYALAATAGLAHIHAHGLRHGDVTLGNLLVSEAAAGLQLKIIDFGLARALRGSSQPDSRFAATPAYLAPEALLLDDQHRPLALDCRSDLFSLGVALYHLSTGCLPFATVQATLSQQVHALPPTSHRAMPQALQEVILHLLEKDPAQRCCTAQAAHAALLQVQVEGCTADIQMDTAARRPTDAASASLSPVAKLYSTLQRHPRTLVCTFALPLLLLGLISLVAPRPPLKAAHGRSQPADFQPLHATGERVPAGAAAFDSLWLESAVLQDLRLSPLASDLPQPKPVNSAPYLVPVVGTKAAAAKAPMPFDLGAYQSSAAVAESPSVADHLEAAYPEAVATVARPVGHAGVASAAQAQSTATSVQAELPFGITVQGRRTLAAGWQLLGWALCGAGGVQHYQFQWLRNPQDGQLRAVRAQASHRAHRSPDGPATVQLQVHFLAPL
jgi:serine/threonine protein kinase